MPLLIKRSVDDTLSEGFVGDLLGSLVTQLIALRKKHHTTLLFKNLKNHQLVKNHKKTQEKLLFLGFYYRLKSNQSHLLRHLSKHQFFEVGIAFCIF